MWDARSVRIDDSGIVPALSSFGEDGSGELYAISLTGTVYEFAEAATP
jgi:hypothetical protein